MPVAAHEPFMAKENRQEDALLMTYFLHCCAGTPYTIRTHGEAVLPAIPLARVHFTYIVCDMTSLPIYYCLYC